MFSKRCPHRDRAAFVAALAAIILMAPAANADPIPPDPGDVYNEGPSLDISQMPPGIDNEAPAEVVPLENGLGGSYSSTGPDGDSGTDADAGTNADVGTTAVPRPPSPPSNLPNVTDAAPGWQPSHSCDPTDKPGMIAFAELISDHYDRPSYSTSRRCIAGNTSQHGEGRAFDWGMNAFDADDKAIGDAVANWITADNGAVARRFGIQSVIWNRESWYLYSPGRWYD